MEFIEPTRAWSPPESWHRVLTVDAHAEGEPLRVVISGFPEPEGVSILERRRYAREHLDHLRRSLMWEPRGHADMYGCILVPPERRSSDIGVLFTHNEGYSTMCGHGILAVTRVVLELGLFRPSAPVTELRIDTPAGRVRSFARIERGRVRSVYFRNVPSWAVSLDRTVEVAGRGLVRYDVAFGGAFYAYVDAPALGLDLVTSNVRELIDAGMAIKRAVADAHSLTHPSDPDLAFLYGTIFIGPASAEGVHSRNVCIFADGEVDRSPTGTGVSGRLALHHARGELQAGESIVIESITGSRFSCRIVEETRVGTLPAIVPEVEGRVFLTGRHEFWIDPDDPFRDGFLVR